MQEKDIGEKFCHDLVMQADVSFYRISDALEGSLSLMRTVARAQSAHSYLQHTK